MVALIIEDDKMSFLIAQALLFNYDISSLHANNEEEAKAQLTDHKVDFILMDIGLPDIDGFELSQKIKSYNDALSEIQIIAMSGTINQITIEKVKKYELQGPLLKPLNKEILSEVLYQLKLI